MKVTSPSQATESMRENRIVPVQDNIDEQPVSPADEQPSRRSPSLFASFKGWVEEYFPWVIDIIEFFSSYENIRVFLIWFLDTAAFEFRISVSTPAIVCFQSIFICHCTVSGTTLP